MQVVYILDQVRALENEMLSRIKNQGLDITPRILIVCSSVVVVKSYLMYSKLMDISLINFVCECDFC